MNYKIEVVLEHNVKFTSFLNTMIRDFNNEHSLHHREVRKEGSRQPINIIITDHVEKWIGGITAEVYWGWVEINKFWIDEELRGRGLGKLLLEETEKIAIKKGAKKALLTTYEFQARSFYEKMGYEVVGEIKDYPPGSSYYTLVKLLI
ncbi:GNAT family N-acetyltransferase [Bacillus sp. FJAT-49870]|uniref:GNAT family N-acetyltransferase n=2 Tax=Lederbergia citri TaxID=2833580 RepID=A0A942TDI0_9BACI|nr:GNAT family N-acetyltransferase [Lederbergia citri]